MIPHFIEDFKRVEQEAIDDMRTREAAAVRDKGMTKEKALRIRDDLRDILEASGVAVDERSLPRLARHVRNLIDQESSDADKRNAEEVVLNVLKKLGMKLLAQEYKNRLR
ncbi:MAG: hypothetical protein KGI69_00445 [Patescibacteria group bacterium]|nr:hypothetical protein [Patescibacteria group bacterium]